MSEGKKREGMWANAGKSQGLLPGRKTFGPLFLMTATPPFAIFMWYTAVHLNGSFLALFSLLFNEGLYGVIRIWPTAFDPEAWKFIGIFMGIQLFLMRVIPSPKFYGPVTPMGNTPVYKGNGVPVFIISVAGYIAGAYLGLYRGGFVYDILGPLFSALNIFSLIFCLVLYLKGRFVPSSTDSGTSGNMVFDYYWGTELYPRIFGWDVKMFTNCRWGMMFWAIANVAYAWKQYELFGFVTPALAVSVSLQLTYISKFFWWETGYLRSIDIMHDRAGYYICWGCLVWVPSVYTSPSMVLVNQKESISVALAVAFFVIGQIGVWVNYAADRQRAQFRACNGKEKIWGKPAQFIVANYTTEKGEKKQSLLLCCGWWGISRHFHYIPEILAAFCWSAVGLTCSVSYFYPLFLVILLVDRAFRDDARCRSKYGKDWDKYCQRVPSLILPGII
eukprot:TRINITY_DN10257_c0_g1_i1.p1 TRINITY_DN10257_c0_g1~~TRINITY_DN10257_c0_g1_i1.p1  ORF type:complete len:446 (+),score=31.42 TRINITY_DN10257_c0_g1_i1:30-1367(+)